MLEFLIYPTNYHSDTFHCVGVDNTGAILILVMQYHVLTCQYVDDIV